MNTPSTMKTTPQTPASGILVSGDYGDSVFYYIPCQCGNEDDAIRVEVEADETGVTTHVWTTVKTNWWDDHWITRYDIDNQLMQDMHWFGIGFLNGLWNRCALTWKIWTKGYLEVESWTIMNKQQTVNFAETLKTAVTQVEAAREKGMKERGQNKTS